MNDSRGRKLTRKQKIILKELGEFKHSSHNYHGLATVTRPPWNWRYVEKLK